MRRSYLLWTFVILLSPFGSAKALQSDVDLLPREIASGPQDQFHVQGIAYDARHECVYMSFTTSLIKVDLKGNLLGSVTGLTGHLGCMALNPDDGKLYASIEYKHDEIGQGIAAGTGKENDVTTGFYVAVFDVDKITHPLMDAQEVMKTVYIREAVSDYDAQVSNQGKMVEHHYGCSGIDGLAIAPACGKKTGRNMLYVAYGIYGDNSRTDNDYQVILCYDLKKWSDYEQPLTPTNLHQSGPEKPTRKYFVYTGNTTYGIQNLAYDCFSNNIYAAVYAGKKEGWSNYSLYVIDGNQKPHRETLIGFDKPEKGYVLKLLPQGNQDKRHGTWGWNFPYGSTGLCSLGNGYFYISHNARDKESKRESTVLHLYKWTGDKDKPFQLVKP